MQINNFISELDTKRFGFKVAKFDAESVNLNELLTLIKSNNVKLIITKISLNNLEILNQLEQNGFLVKDIQVTYKFDLSDPITYIEEKQETEIALRNATNKDIKDVELLARNSFSNYGHYAADNKLPASKVGDIYGDWAKRSIEEKNIADKIIIAEINNEIVGFLSFKIYSQKGLSYAAGGLGAVAEKFRSKNIFRSITIAGLEWGKLNNLDWEEHNVLITNYPVNRSFTKLGFKVYKSFATMHCWI